MPKAKKVGDQWSVLAYLGKDESGKKVYKRVSGDNKTIVELEAAQLAIEAKKHSKTDPAVTSESKGNCTVGGRLGLEFFGWRIRVFRKAHWTLFFRCADIRKR